MADSILTSIKKSIGGIPDAYEALDADIILIINSEFGKLNQLGVGPEEGFQIESKEETWDDFETDIRIVNMVKEYISLRVKVAFDNSTASSTVLNLYNEKADELQWRLNIAAENLNEE